VSDEFTPHCPSCGYDLRGLEGDAVTCPECGQRVDLVVLDRIVRTQNEHVPGVSDLNFATYQLVFLVLIIVPVLLASESKAVAAMLVTLLLGSLLVGYCIAVVRVMRKHPDAGLRWLALLMHLLNLVAILTVIVMAVLAGAVIFAMMQSPPASVLNPLAGLMVLAPVYAISRYTRLELVQRLRRRWALRTACLD